MRNRPLLFGEMHFLRIVMLVLKRLTCPQSQMACYSDMNWKEMQILETDTLISYWIGENMVKSVHIAVRSELLPSEREEWADDRPDDSWKFLKPSNCTIEGVAQWTEGYRRNTQENRSTQAPSIPWPAKIQMSIFPGTWSLKYKFLPTIVWDYVCRIE
jgi:hypothetical protein